MIKNLLNILILLISVFLILWLKRPLVNLLSVSSESDLNLRLMIAFFLRIAIIILSLKVMIKLNLVRFNGLLKGSKFYNLQAVILPIIIVFIGIFSNYQTYIATNNITLFIFFISVVSVGFSEEFVFRGLVFPILLRSFSNYKGKLFWSVFISSLLFGSSHYLNIFSQQTNFSSLTSQVLFAFLIGVFFIGLMLRTSSIVVPSVIHGLINFSFGVAILKKEVVMESVKSLESGMDWNMIVPTTIFYGLILGGGIFMIRKSEANDLLKKLRN